jgi:hypothetical protein
VARVAYTRSVSNVRVTYAELEAVRAEMTAAHQRLDEELKLLQQRVRLLTDSGFITPQATPKFREAYDQWTAGTLQAAEGLLGMAAFLQAAVDGWREVDSAQAGMLGQ